jgi:hypothetical protein
MGPTAPAIGVPRSYISEKVGDGVGEFVGLAVGEGVGNGVGGGAPQIENPLSLTLKSLLHTSSVPAVTTKLLGPSLPENTVPPIVSVSQQLSVAKTSA